MTHPVGFIKTLLRSQDSELFLINEHVLRSKEHAVKCKGSLVIDGVTKLKSHSHIFPLDQLEKAEQELREKMVKELALSERNIRKALDEINRLIIPENSNYRGAFETFALRLNGEVPEFRDKVGRRVVELGAIEDVVVELDVAGVRFSSRYEVLGCTKHEACKEVSRLLLKQIFEAYGFNFH